MKVALHMFAYLSQSVFLWVERWFIIDRFNVIGRDLSREAHGDRTTALCESAQPFLRTSGPGAEYRARRPQGPLEVVIKLITSHFRIDPFDSTTLGENAGIRSVEVAPGENPYGKEIRPLPGHNRKVTRLDALHEEPDLPGVTTDHVQGTIRIEKPQSLSEPIPASYAGDVFPETEPEIVKGGEKLGHVAEEKWTTIVTERASLARVGRRTRGGGKGYRCELGVFWFIRGLGWSVLAATPETVAVAIHLQDVDVVGEPVQQRAGQPLRSEDLGPLVEGQVGGH